MIVEAFPALSHVSVVLAPEDAGLDFRDVGGNELRDRVEFGGPLVAAIDEYYRPDDADLQAFVRSQAKEWRFLVAHMSIYFPPAKPPPLSEAAVHVSLSDQDGGQTVAFSLFPTRAGTTYDTTQGYTLSPNLTVGPVSAGLGSKDHSTTDHGTRDFVVGGPELSANPTWTFRATPTQQLYGSTRLVMIIRSPAGRTGSMSVDVSAQIEEGRFRKRGIPLQGASEVNPAVVSF